MTYIATIIPSTAGGVKGATVDGFLLNAAAPATPPAQFNLSPVVEGRGVGRQGIFQDHTSPYLGVFNR